MTRWMVHATDSAMHLHSRHLHNRHALHQALLCRAWALVWIDSASPAPKHPPWPQKVCGFDCKNHTSLDTYTADSRIPLQSDDYVVLEIPEFKGIIDDPHGDGQNDFAKILLDCEQGDTAFYSNTLYVLQKTFNPRIELSKITVNFKVHGGYLYNFHGLEHSLTFRIQSLKQKIYSDIDVRTHLDRENQEAMEEHTAQMEEIIILLSGARKKFNLLHKM